MCESPSKIKDRLSLGKCQEAAIDKIKEYNDTCKETTTSDLLRVVLMEIVLRTGAVFGSLTTRKKNKRDRPIRICTHTKEEEDFIINNILVVRENKLAKWLKRLSIHEGGRVPAKLPETIKEPKLRRQRKNFYAELQSVSSVVSIDIFGEGFTSCRLTILLPGDHKKDLPLIWTALSKFKKKFYALYPWKWLNKNPTPLHLLSGKSGVGIPTSVSYRMLGLPDNSISNLLDDLNSDKDKVIPPKKHGYKAYILWPEEYSTKFHGYLRHWPTETQLDWLKGKLGYRKLEKFLGISWQKESAICNYVAETGLPYYSSNWRGDTKQDYLDVEKSIMFAPDIYQIPILCQNKLLAILAFNTKPLSNSDRLAIYERVVLETQLILKAAESDVKRAKIVRDAVEEQLKCISHEMRVDLIEYMDSTLRDMYIPNQISHNTLTINADKLKRLLQTANYLHNIFFLHRNGKAGFGDLSISLKPFINKDTVQEIPMRSFIEDADYLVQASGKAFPKCLFQNWDDEVHIQGVSGWLRVVFFNLIHNARKHFNNKKQTRKDSSIVISRTEQGNYVKISISDSSGGIDPDIINRIFHYNFSFGKYKGAGIGLYLVQKIIKAHMGEIIPYRISNGTKFEICLPKKLLGKEN